MSEQVLLPIIEQLADCRTDQERIDWLLACPFAILRKYDFTIRNRMHVAGLAGIDGYLDAVAVAMSATRSADGFWRQEQYDLIQASIETMTARARLPEQPAADPPPPDDTPVPDHSLTEI